MPVFPFNQTWQAKNLQASLNALAWQKLLPVAYAGVPTSGTSGTNAGLCEKGCLLTDTTNGILYVNTGTLASPTWTKVGTQT